ncbi:MAG: sigma-70 family RNA polymerase sigma factor [Bacteroidales bacterium]|nr:sigma-70 family RNA polymerase sigma factor [Candidatus Physcousia equi]
MTFRDDILPLKDKLYRLALRVVCDRAEAEDIVQDTMLRLWERRDEWEQIRSLEAYALTLCRNIALDRCKAARQGNLSLDEQQDSPIDLRTPFDQLDERQRVEQLMRSIDRLPEVQRSIVLLRHVEEKSYDEIASILSLSTSQVKVYLHRARQRLKAQVE